MLQICLEDDVCLYHPNARWGGEFEWLKMLQGPQQFWPRVYFENIYMYLHV